MTEDRFWEQLRRDARALRFEPDEFMTGRIAAAIRTRIASRPTSTVPFLAGWFRPLGAAFGAIAIVSLLGVAWIDRNSALETASPELSPSTSTIEISAAGETFSVD